MVGSEEQGDQGAKEISLKDASTDQLIEALRAKTDLNPAHIEVLQGLKAAEEPPPQTAPVESPQVETSDADSAPTSPAITTDTRASASEGSNTQWVERILAHPQIVHQVGAYTERTTTAGTRGYITSWPDYTGEIPGLKVRTIQGTLDTIGYEHGSPAEELFIFHPNKRWAATGIIRGNIGDQQVYPEVQLGPDAALVVELMRTKNKPKYWRHFALLARNRAQPSRGDFAYLMSVPANDGGDAIREELRRNPEVMLEVLKGKYGLSVEIPTARGVPPYRLSENLHVINRAGIRRLPASPLGH